MIQIIQVCLIEQLIQVVRPQVYFNLKEELVLCLVITSVVNRRSLVLHCLEPIP